MVELPNQVVVESKMNGQDVTYLVHVAPTDVGKLMVRLGHVSAQPSGPHYV